MKFSAALSHGKWPVMLLIAGAAAYAYSTTHVLVDTYSGGKLRLYPRSVFGKEVVDLKTGRTTRLKADGRTTLLVLLSGSECPSCLDESRTWDRLAARPDRIRVAAIFVGATTRDVGNYIAQRKPSYEVYQFSRNEGEEAFGGPFTHPLSVLLDRWGRVLYASGPTGLPSEHQRFARTIGGLIASPEQRSQK